MSSIHRRSPPSIAFIWGPPADPAGRDRYLSHPASGSASDRAFAAGPQAGLWPRSGARASRGCLQLWCPVHRPLRHHRHRQHRRGRHRHQAGRPGALFWMWMAALFGMATKYAECLLAVKYRQQDANGQMAGGPMYYLEKASAPGRSPRLFALFGIGVAFFGIGTFPRSTPSVMP